MFNEMNRLDDEKNIPRLWKISNFNIKIIDFCSYMPIIPDQNTNLLCYSHPFLFMHSIKFNITQSNIDFDIIAAHIRYGIISLRVSSAVCLIFPTCSISAADGLYGVLGLIPRLSRRKLVNLFTAITMAMFLICEYIERDI